ncbi:MAG: phospholipase [Planctomycetes bacterium HGW-Planctomycetes-1]|nr:MAG: phospholipase [Planctomycetes bacterium HGW-Planctomycetes-1]
MSKSKQQKKNFKTQVNMKYLLYLPDGYDKKGQSWPLIVFLHGAGEREDDLEKVKMQGIPKMLEKKADFPFVVVSPQCLENAWWTGYAETLKALIDRIKAKYNIDPSRVYLTGISMGGFGTWYLAARYPQDFAAIAPICGGGELLFVKNLKMPIWVFHGAKDDVVPLRRSQEMVDAVKAAGGDVKFTIYPELKHDSWTVTYENEELYKWFLSHKKQ